MLKIHLATASIALALCAQGHARPARDNEVIYFADAAMKTAVGTFYMDCYGHTTKTGIVAQGKSTRYWVRYQEACPGGSFGDLGPNCYLDGISATCTPGMALFFKRS